MNINRNNYEEYFLLYVDNELTPAERKAVENFVSVNTDLLPELQVLQDTILKPEKSILFDLKSSLLHTETNGIVNESNCEDYFILYADNELDEARKEEVEQFVQTHPAYQQNFDLFKQTKLQPDKEIVFADKSSLYRKEKDDKVVPFAWWKLMAAAVIMLMTGLSVWYLFMNDQNKPDSIVQTPVTKNPAVKETPAKEETPVTNNNQKKVKENVTDPSAKKNSVSYQLATTQTLPEKSKRNTQISGNDIITVNEQGKKKKEEAGSNIPTPPNVTLTEEVAVNPEQKNQQPLINDTKPNPNETVLATNMVSGTAEQYDTPVYADESDKDIIYVANTSVSKKNKLRGLVRQASRIFEKATSLEPVRNRGIRIASFEVGIK